VSHRIARCCAAPLLQRKVQRPVAGAAGAEAPLPPEFICGGGGCGSVGGYRPGVHASTKKFRTAATMIIPTESTV